MSTELDQNGWPLGVDRIVLDEVDSTMAEAARRARSTRTPAWIMARRQMKGRGRRGRAWTDPAGNFAGTLLMFPQEPLAEVALNSFVAALALRQALKTLAPSEDYTLKWPNDVLLGGRKIAGILLETAGAGPQADWLSIGIGVNLRTAPAPEVLEARALPPTSIEAALGVVVEQEALLDLLAIDFHTLRGLMRAEGFAPIRLLWLRHAARLGEVVTARTMRDEITGTFADVDGAGNLILETAKGRTAIAAADVYF